MPNLVYPNQHIDAGTRWFKRDHVIVPYIVKITFNLDIESTDKICIFDNVSRAVVKKVLIFGTQEIDVVNNTRILSI